LAGPIINNTICSASPDFPLLCSMKRLVFLGILIIQLFACNNNSDTNQTPSSENDVDAARNFIRAALDGKWSDARRFMIQDSLNVQLLETVEAQYQKKDREEKRGYREASITLFDTKKLSDSLSIVSYSNTFKKQKESLKVVDVNGQWLIDLKYSLLPIDSTKRLNNTDTIGHAK
jgi:hypothetical protein